MKNKSTDPFEDFVKKWKKRAELMASLLSWIIHLFLIVGISTLITYYHFEKIQEDLHRTVTVESQNVSVTK